MALAVLFLIIFYQKSMARYNKTLAHFELVGIPPAPRGMSQIEVSFDIDANGIVNVSARNTATGKKQSIQITASSGLTKEEIDRAIRDAELKTEEDKRKKELIHARNTVDTLIYSTEKSLKELHEKLDGGTKTQVQEAVKNLKRAMKGEDAVEIKRLTDVLTHASHGLAETVYRQNAPSGELYQSGTADKTATRSSNADDDVVDAEYQEVA